jgi:hypothetical protein
MCPIPPQCDSTMENFPRTISLIDADADGLNSDQAILFRLRLSVQ